MAINEAVKNSLGPNFFKLNAKQFSTLCGVIPNWQKGQTPVTEFMDIKSLRTALDCLAERDTSTTEAQALVGYAKLVAEQNTMFGEGKAGFIIIGLPAIAFAVYAFIALAF